jgi:glycerol-3-phosphate dehydrogenase
MLRSKIVKGTLLSAAGLITATAAYGYYEFNKPLYNSTHSHPLAKEIIPNSAIPARNQQINKLKQSTANNTPNVNTNNQNKNSNNNADDFIYDVLIIGGGATGSGCALDAVTRGLSVALVERDDFCSGTSSRSTKLIHGGVRYLEKAFTNLDSGQLHLVRDALRERKHLLAIAPHLSRPLPIIVPLYQPFPQILFYAPYTYIGTKFYDFFAGKAGVLAPSYWLSSSQASQNFPMLRRSNLQGGVVYYDGQHNDSRMGLAIALTAAARGATVANHVEVISLMKNQENRVVGANLRDLISGEQFSVRAKTVINATGPFCDGIRKMADNALAPIITPSSGVHVTIPGDYCPQNLGLIIPKTRDGRVLFMLPWENSTIVGTTDSSTEITALPGPTEAEISFILREISLYTEKPIERSAVKAAWSGIRPLARDSSAKDTASTSRDHVIELTAPGIITITGGKWTTYRKMAEDTIDKVISLENQGEIHRNNQLTPCCTVGTPLIGAAGFNHNTESQLKEHFPAFSSEICAHLAHNYGDKAFDVAELAQKTKLFSQLAPNFPFLEAEIIYSMRHEYAETAVDVISNRLRLSYLDSNAAGHALPRVISIMSKENGWNDDRKLIEYSKAAQFLQTMNRKGRKSNLHSTYDYSTQKTAIEERYRSLFNHEKFPARDISELKALFDELDSDRDAHLNENQVSQLIQRSKAFGFGGKLKTDEENKKFLLKFAQQLDLHTETVKGIQSGGSAEEEERLVGWEELLFSAAAAYYLVKKAK